MRIFVTIYFLSIISQIGGYSQELIFKHLSVNDGLVSDMVHTILQDSDGFMWFGTEDGLCRYDGYSFLPFYHSPNDSMTLSNNLVTCLAEDVNKNIWIGTRHSLNMLDRETYKIKRIKMLLNGNELPTILSILSDRNDKIWVGSDTQGLFCVDINTYEVTHYQHSELDNNSISNNTVNCLLNDPDRGILVGTSSGLNIFSPSNSRFKHLLDDTKIKSLNYQKDGSVFIGMISPENYFYKLVDESFLERIEIPLGFSEKQVIPFCDSQNNLWISVRDYACVFVNAQNEKIQHLIYNKHNIDGISSNAINSIYEDLTGNIWIATQDAGINILQNKRKAFIHVKNNYLNTGLQNNKVRSIFEDSQQNIWIGTKANGTLSKFNRETSEFTHFKHIPNKPYSLSNDFILSITEDSPGNLWIGTLNGLNLFDIKSGTSKVLFHDNKNSNSLASNSIYALLKDKNELLIGHAESGLDIYNTQTKCFTNFQKTDSSRSISDNRIKVIYKDQSNNIWVGTIQGLNLFNRKTNTFVQFLNSTEDSTSISDNYILSIYEDQQQNLWIGTQLGVNLMNRKNNTFKVFTTENGLPGNAIRGILNDDKGNLWVSTNNGLSKFNTSTGKFKNYNKYDGLAANEFSPFVNCKTHDGQLLFGSNNGFTMFDPAKITDNENIPKVIITGFKLYNKEIAVNAPGSPLKKHISQTKRIQLKHAQSVFSIEYVALNFTSPEKNQYAYMLEGFEKEWNYIGNRREVTYTNLDPGDYTFKVKASNNDGYWNNKPVILKIKVLPPYWLTWWAYCMYAIVSVGLLILLWLYSIKRVNEGREKERNRENMKFFINVSHEFRTPLTLISSPLTSILESGNVENKAAAQTIQLSANKLLNLVNQLLDFRKTDMGKFPLHAVKTDIVNFTKNISDLFKKLAKSKNIILTFSCLENTIEAWIDPEKFEKILNNLIANAIKYTQPGGHISVDIQMVSQVRKTKPSQYVEIRVHDTGIGLSPQQIKYVFERFYSNDNSRTGTGIGLNYTKSLVDLHGGNISVKSIENEGSTFIVQLLCGNKHLKIDQMSETDFYMEDFQFGSNHIEALRYDLETSDDIATLRDQEKAPPNRTYPVVLVVEDNKQLRNQITSSLADKFSVVSAIDGQNGWDLAVKHAPDLIITDVKMPRMDGIELCRNIKNDMRTSHIPVILLTAQTTDNKKISGFESGADQYVIKPFSFEVLKTRVKSLLDQRNALKQIFSKKMDVTPSEITVTSIDEKMIQKAIETVEQNISISNFSVDDLSYALDISRGHLYRKLMSITGKSPSDFIRTVRLKRAAQLLTSSGLTVSEIAYGVGFSAPKYFTKCFKAEFGTIPSEYAKASSDSD